MRLLRVVLAMGVVLCLVALVVSGTPEAWAKGGEAPTGLNFILLRHPKPLPPLRFSDAAGHPRGLAEFRGKFVLLNIWATWCPGCREEISALNRLELRLGGPKFQVVAISVDQGGAATVDKFLAAKGAHALKIYLNPSISVPNKLGVFGIPTSFLIDAEGREIGEVLGPAAWDRPAVLDWLRSYLPAAVADGKVGGRQILAK